jgi:hypothetical protein
VQHTYQLRRDLQWWTQVPSANNGRSIFSPIETAYLHCYSSRYGLGAILNEQLEARGLWLATDQEQHITWKELKAVRLAVLSFLFLLRGRKVLLHEDNQAVVALLSHLTSRSPAMMDELRKLWELIDTNNISIRARYNRSAANVWAERLSRETYRADWQLNPRIFTYVNSM